MKAFFRMIAVLTLICAVSGSLLAWVNALTADAIREAEQAEKTRAIRNVLPSCDNDPVADAVDVETAQGAWTVHPAYQDGQFVGAAFMVTSTKGYGGDIDIMVGVQADDTLKAIEILAHKETPGLGAKIASADFRDTFAGRPAVTTDWRVTKDGGAIDAITAATISSRAVTEAVGAGLKRYAPYKARLAAAAQADDSHETTGRLP